MTELAEGEKLYRIGLNSDCPVHQITIGGQCFPRTSERVSGDGIDTKRAEMPGAIVIMSPGQWDKILQDVKYKVIRSTKGKKTRSRVYDTRGRRYQKKSADVGVAGFVYGFPLTETENPHGVVNQPPIGDEAATQEKPKAAKGAKPKPEPEPKSEPQPAGARG